MAATRSGVTLSCIARCFLRQRGKSKSYKHTFPEGWNETFLQRSHLHIAVDCRSPATRAILGRRHNGRILLVSAVSVRHNSSQPIADQVAEAVPTALGVLQGAGAELRLDELGLGSATPAGFIQNLLEFIHGNLGLPWWGAIVTATVLVRLVMVPLEMKAHTEAAKYNRVAPEITKLTDRMKEGRRRRDKAESVQAFSDLRQFLKKHNVNPFYGVCLNPLLQMPVFVSFFIALRQMSTLPVPSMETGGILWFTNLTAADPFFILPLAATGTMFFVMELGVESGPNNSSRVMKTMTRIMPFAILPFTVNLPTAVFTYWLTSNCISLGQVALFRRPLRHLLEDTPPQSPPPSRGDIQRLEIADPGDLVAPPKASAKSPNARAQPTSGKKRPWKETIG